MLEGTPDTVSGHRTSPAPPPPALTQVFLALIPFGFFAMSFWIFWQDLHSPDPYNTFTDDFYYYAGVARGFLAHGFPTFDGMTLTNGFHPLWEAVITLLLAAFGPSGMMFAVSVVASFAVLAVYWLIRRLLRQGGITGPANWLIATVLTFLYLPMIRSGMEVILAIPALMLLASYAASPRFQGGFRGWLTFGLLGSLGIFCRVDMFLFVFTLLALLVLRQLQMRTGPKLTWAGFAGLLLGLSPFLVYLAVNQHYLGYTLPISGNAKQLKVGLWPVATSLYSVYFVDHRAALWYTAALAGLVVSLWTRRSRQTISPVMLAAFCFPWLHLAALSIRSDWPLFGWYYYSSTLAVVFAVILASERIPALPQLYRRLAQTPQLILRATAVTICLFLAVRGELEQRKHAKDDLLSHTALAVARFSADHPGRFAMGDRAGIVGWMLPEGLVQTEGLTMDGRFLEAIRDRKDLIDTLRVRNVRYFVASSPTEANGCYFILEPKAAGNLSPKLHATLCAPPALEIDYDKPGLGEDYPIRTYIFDLEGLRQTPDGVWHR